LKNDFGLDHFNGICVFPILKPPRNSTLKTAIAAISSRRNKLVVSRTVALIIKRRASFAFFCLLGLVHSNGNLKRNLLPPQMHAISKVKQPRGKMPVFYQREARFLTRHGI